MSYCRHDGITSDVYLYHDVDNGIICMGCLLLGDCSGHALFWSQRDALEHLKLHREAGHLVPDYVFTRLRKEWRDGGTKRAAQHRKMLTIFARLKQQQEARMKRSQKSWGKLNAKIKRSTLAHDSRDKLLKLLKEARVLEFPKEVSR